jgi:hypothetical protein
MKPFMFLRPLLALTLLSTQARAFDLPNLQAINQGKTLSLQYSGSLEPSSQLAIHQESLKATVQTWSDDQNRVYLDGRAAVLDLVDQPDDLYEYVLGATYLRQLGEERSVSVNASFGSASDHPFADGSVDTLGATATYGFASSPRSKWLLLVNYSNNRPILNGIPLPGFAYTYVPSREFRLTVGAPFAAIYWQFAPDWSLTAFTVIPWVARASVAYRITGPVQLFASFDFSQQTFLRLGRANEKERIFYDEKKATLGVRSPLSSVLSAELEGGYAFGRRFFNAESYGADKFGENALDAGALVRLGLTASL